MELGSMLVKVPESLVTFPHGAEIVVYNYLTRDAITCAPADIYWLTVAPKWTAIEDIVEAHPHIESQSLRNEIQSLVGAGMLLESGTPAAEMEAKFEESWELGRAAALFHFTALDNEFATPGASIQKQKERALVDPSPELFSRNSSTAIALPCIYSSKTEHLFDVMMKRRTNRRAKQDAISLQHLSECLYSGLGITGFVKTETGLLPLKMTPSGGARNPFEAYVWVQRVDGLNPGIYHYSALEHSLEVLESKTNQSPSQLLGGQDWTNDMPAIVFLMAELRRTTWKYNDPNAYRVVLIEAGHIAQNMMLTCTNNNLTACPTAALCHSKVSALLGLENITQTPIYALAIGKPDSNTDDIIDIKDIRDKKSSHRPH